MPNITDVPQLTERETEVLQMLAKGWSNQQIADELCIALPTVKFHTKNIYIKIGVCSRSQAIAWKYTEMQNQSEI